MVRRICIVGTIQSGSTRLFNLVRLLYEMEGKSVLSRWKYDISSNNNDDYDVIVSKVHDCNKDYLKDFDIVLLPIRNILDAGISSNKRFGVDIKKSCLKNLNLINKFEKLCDMRFIYERYSLNYIKKLCKVLCIKEVSNIKLIGVMRELESMLLSKDIVKKDNFKDEEYRKSLLSQGHNTSGGKSNKYVMELSDEEMKDLLSNDKIRKFINNYEY